MIFPSSHTHTHTQPLSTQKDSRWNEWFLDGEALEAIERDVRRTLPTLHFFSQEGGGRVHARALRDALFVYSKLNKATRYVQGMNEVLAPLYYVFASDSGTSTEEAEADSFFCLSALLAESVDCFCKQLDHSMLDSHSTIGRFHALLAVLDPVLFRNMHEKTLDPRFYSLRWLSLLFSQEFELPDVLRLWDSLFGDHRRFEFLLFFACAAIILQRDSILSQGFSENLFLLQNYPPTDMNLLIAKARELRARTDPAALESWAFGMGA